MKLVELTDDIDFDIDEKVDKIEYGLSELQTAINESTPLQKDISSMIAQYVLYDFKLELDSSMIEYKSCKEWQNYQIDNIFKKYRYKMFCSQPKVTEFDVLLNLSSKNHFLADNDNDIKNNNDNKNDEEFLIKAIECIAPDECTEPVQDILVWVFNDKPDGFGIYNRRFNVNEIEFDSNFKKRDERKPVMVIHEPKISEITVKELPPGIIGRYVLLKFMAKSNESENVDVQYCGIRVCRL